MTAAAGENQIHILLVEDDEVDAEALVRAVDLQNIKASWTLVNDGVQALSALRGRDGYVKPQQPCVIVLDLNLPRMNGIEFLTALRADPALHRHIVFVLTTSNRYEDKLAAYDRHIAGYCVKGRRRRDGMTSLINLLQHYRQTVEFPPE